LAAPRREPQARIIQTSLLLGPASDRWEQEADRLARQMVGRAAQQPAAGDARTGRVKRTSGVRRPQSARGDALDARVQQAIRGARGGGQPLSEQVRGRMEEALGADFSRVRLHTDAQADQLTRLLQARAFTTGREIFFRRGEYSQGGTAGRRLLAHELTHVTQQTAGGPDVDGARGSSSSRVPSGTAGAGVIQRMVIEGLDTEKPRELARLRQKVRKMTRLSDIDAMISQISSSVEPGAAVTAGVKDRPA